MMRSTKTLLIPLVQPSTSIFYITYQLLYYHRVEIKQDVSLSGGLVVAVSDS